MSIVFTYYDLVEDLQALIEGRLSSETLCLYQGSHTPTQGDNSATYLGIEVNWGGYARIALTWSDATLSSDSIGTSSSQVCTWAPTTSANLPETVGGVFALDSTGALAWADLLPGGPVVVSRVGQPVSYQAVVTQGEQIL
jgi:hypothetical protein